VAPPIREPKLEELEQLRDIERAAGVLFAEAGMADVAAHEPETVVALAEYARAGRAWVATDGTDSPIGYAVVDVVDGQSHLEQLSVLPASGKRGVGTALLEHVCEQAAAQGYRWVTLTTFIDIPWNAPFYAKHGFERMSGEEIGPELRALLVTEAEHGLDPAQRVCMRRGVAS
jgi:GNAT superfamily N-acetyltransferase